MIAKIFDFNNCRTTEAGLSALQSVCNAACPRWVDLVNYQQDGVIVQGAEILIDTCGPLTSALNAGNLCSAVGGYLFNLRAFVTNTVEIETFLGGQGSGSIFLIPEFGPVQNTVGRALVTNGVVNDFHVDLNITFTSPFSVDAEGLWQNGINNPTNFDPSIELLQELTDAPEQNCAFGYVAPFEGGEAGGVLGFDSIDCFIETLRPLCMRGTSITLTSTTVTTVPVPEVPTLIPQVKKKNQKKQRLKWLQKKKQSRRNQRKIKGNNRRGKRSTFEGRQATSGIPVDMCIGVLPVLPFLPFLAPGILSSPAIVPAPVAPAPVPPPAPVVVETVTSLSPIQSYEQFIQRFPQNQQLTQQQELVRREIFQQNVDIINSHNAQYLAAQATFFMTMNVYGDLTLGEFAAVNTGVGLFRAAANVTDLDPTVSRGTLPVNNDPPQSLDLALDPTCQSGVRKQVCNSCSSHAAVSSIEYCLCQAGGARSSLGARSVQQLSECTDGRVLDRGSQLERNNAFCETGFPDVHLDYVVSDLRGQVEAEVNNPESEVQGECQPDIRDANIRSASVRVQDYLADYFTTEDYLLDTLSQVGPTATNIAVTQGLKNYGGGIYYNPEECTNYIEEEVPEQCRVTRAGRETYTCLTTEDGVDCAELMPQHCDIFFKSSDTSYHHSVTVTGYDEDEEGVGFWSVKNSWGDSWGEGGFFRIARGFGHCSFGTFYTVPVCR